MNDADTSAATFGCALAAKLTGNNMEGFLKGHVSRVIIGSLTLRESSVTISLYGSRLS